MSSEMSAKEKFNALLYNPPEQNALSYRIGNQPTFLQNMLDQLQDQISPNESHEINRPLSELQTRDRDDPAIALLDAWAMVLDVLTFYQERIANEGYLRTATERRSILEMARAVGYELSPGVAASTLLSFTVEDMPGAPEKVIIPKGTPVQSTPGQNQVPQTFETEEEIEARAEWNALKPRFTEPQEIGEDTSELYLKGVETRVQSGDALLVLDDNGMWDFGFVRRVTPHIDDTLIIWNRKRHTELSGGSRIFAFRFQGALFGHNAPDWRIIPDEVKSKYTNELKCEEWPGFEIGEGNQIDLDTACPKILPGTWIVLTEQDTFNLFKVQKTAILSRTDFSIVSKTTRITLDRNESLNAFGLRDTVVFGQSELLELAEKPLTTPIKDNKIVLNRYVAGLKQGQPVCISGLQANGIHTDNPAQTEDDKIIHEIAYIDEISDDKNNTAITLRKELHNRYIRKSVVINANLVTATHGETGVREVLGSGDGTQVNQKFILKKIPLTFTSSSDSDGTDCALEIRINDIRWREVPSLYGQNANSLCYMVQVNDQGQATVIFGDGKAGSRLPSGTENIVAVYRTGIGPEGEVDAGSLSLLKSRPLGIRNVTNPLPANGAAPADTLELARANAPLALITIDRLISLRDFEDFARAFAGIGKARAVIMWSGEARIVHITVADADGDQASKFLCKNLNDAMIELKDPAQSFRIDPYEQLFFNIELTVLIKPEFDEDFVREEIKTCLQNNFTFEKRNFGQHVSASEIIAMIQNIDGVIAVDLDYLYFSDPDKKMLNPILNADDARWEGENKTQGAQLVLLDPDRDFEVAISVLETTEGSDD